MATSHRLPRRNGPSTAEPGGVRVDSADLHSLAMSFAVAVSAGREPRTLSSFVIQKVFSAGGTDSNDAGGEPDFDRTWGANAACRSARLASFCSSGSI